YRRRRGPGSGRSAMIDLVFHELDSAWAIEVIRGVEKVARAEGLSVVLTESGGAQTPRDDWVDAVLARQAPQRSWSFRTWHPSSAPVCPHVASLSSWSTPQGTRGRTCPRSVRPTGTAVWSPRATSSSWDTAVSP